MGQRGFLPASQILRGPVDDGVVSVKFHPAKLFFSGACFRLLYSCTGPGVFSLSWLTRKAADTTAKGNCSAPGPGSFAGQAHHSFNKKYRNAQKLNSDLPIVIIFSNLHPKDMYTQNSGAAALPLLYARFSILQLMSCPAGQKNPGSGNRSPDPSSPATPVLRSRHSTSSQHPLPETEAVAQAAEEEAAQAEEEEAAQAEAAQADEEGKRTTEEGGSGEAEDGGWLGGRGGKSTEQ